MPPSCSYLWNATRVVHVIFCYAPVYISCTGTGLAGVSIRRQARIACRTVLSAAVAGLLIFPLTRNRRLSNAHPLMSARRLELFLLFSLYLQCRALAGNALSRRAFRATRENRRCVRLCCSLRSSHSAVTLLSG
jgi:hypothetical protein